ncbi:STX8 family protein [Megaselia abdita]
MQNILVVAGHTISNLQTKKQRLVIGHSNLFCLLTFRKKLKNPKIMALLALDTWENEFDSVVRLSESIQLLISQRSKELNNSESYSKISYNTRLKLRQFETEVGDLEIKLSASSRSGELTVEETERRQRQVETLRSKLLTLKNKFLSLTRSDRELLMETNRANSLWENDEDDAPIIPTTNSNALNIRDNQVRIMEQQNRGLDVLSQTISRQRELASRLGTEVVDQNHLLDNIADNMDRLDGSVNQETDRIAIINRQDKTWGYWLVIIALFIAIIVVIIL